MEKIYWDKAEQQIKTREGKCVYNKEDWVSPNVIHQSSKVTKRMNLLEQQLRCAAKGHRMRYSRYQDSGLTTDPTMDNWNLFKCRRCGLEVTKTKKELTPTEREALGKLKLL